MNGGVQNLSNSNELNDQNLSNSNELNDQNHDIQRINFNINEEISYYLRNNNNGSTWRHVSRFLHILPFLELNTSVNEEINNDDGNNNG